MTMTANEARSITSKSSIDLDSIYSLIKSAALSGRNEVFTDRPLTQAERDLLVNDGFAVASCSSFAAQRDGIYHHIKWG